MNQKVATDIKSVKTIKAFNKAYRKHLLRKSMPDNLKIPITTDIATLIISISINLSVTYDYTWGNSFVAVSSWDFCHNKILSDKKSLWISTWAKHLIMDETPRVFILMEYWRGGLRAGSCFFSVVSIFFLG